MLRRFVTLSIAIVQALGFLGATSACFAAPLRDRAGSYEVQVLVGGVPVRTFAHHNETWALGGIGERYVLRVTNHSSERIEAVVSVDGRDVMDGKAADFRAKRGYLVPAYGQVDIDGWRLSGSEVAAFRFSSVADSYAGRTGSAREVGVIGVAVFPERHILPRTRFRAERGPSLDDDALAEGSPRPQAPELAEERKSRSGASGEASSSAPSDDAPAATIVPEAEASSRSSDALAKKGAPSRSRRPGLGTEFGEAVGSHVTEIPFDRANPTRPAALFGVRYNDREGLVAIGIDVDRWPYAYESEGELRRTADPFPKVERSSYAAPPRGWRR